MAEEQKQAKPKSGGSPPPESQLTKWVGAAGDKLVPLLVSAVVSVGFVAFAGKAVLWVRFTALQVPGDQVVKAVPQGEAVATGASMLLIFGALGALAALGVYLIDRGGRATADMSRGVLAIAAVEAGVAVWFTEGKSLEARIVASEIVLLAVGAVLWATYVAHLTKPAKVPTLKKGEKEPEHRCGPFYQRRDKKDAESGDCGVTYWTGIPKHGVRKVCLAAAALGGIAYAVAAAVFHTGAGWAWVAALGAFGLFLLLAVLEHCHRYWKKEEAKARTTATATTKENDEKGDGSAAEPKKDSAEEAESRAWERARKRAEWRADLLTRLVERLRSLLGSSPSVVVVAELPSEPPEDGSGKAGEDEPGPAPDPKPPGVDFSGWGLLFAACFTAVLIVGPSWILHEWWVAVALGVVAIASAVLWRIATLAERRFIWYGLAVFLSVPVFGTAMLMARNADEPQVQPMALIRSTDGPDESIQGLYVTESDDRVYFANVATEGCEDEVRPHSGRLLWVPKKEVVAISIGPLQGVKEAGRTALEMAYDLTPAVETGAATISLVEEEDEEEAQAGASHNDTRLENVGPAVRPDFGAGLRIEPEFLAPGEEATLRMSEPNENDGVEGFGSSRNGRNLRLGGRILDISKESSDAARAEYVETQKGRLIDFAKGGLYVKENGDFAPLDEEEGSDGDADNDAEGLYLRLDDPAVVEVDGQPVGEEPTYVKVDDAGAEEVPEGAQSVTLAAGSFEGRTWDREVVELAGLPLRRQAWSTNRIRFHVPDDAKSGVVTVECDQLAGSALLQVKRSAQARISVQTQPNSPRITFDSGASTTSSGVSATGSATGTTGPTGATGSSGPTGASGATGALGTTAAQAKSTPAPVKDPLKRRWRVDGVLVSHRKAISPVLTPRMTPYTVELTVTDRKGKTDSAKLEVLRVPAPDLGGKLGPSGKPAGKIRRAYREAREAIEAAVEANPPKAVEIDGYANRHGPAAGRVPASLEKAEAVRKRLLREDEAAEASGAAGERETPEAKASSEETPEAGIAISVEEFGHGASCDLRKGPAPANLHVDLLLLGEGVFVKPADGCSARAQKHESWHAPKGPAD